MTAVYMYSPGETETGKTFRQQLCSRIGLNVVTGVPTVGPEHVPLVIIVHNFSRIGTDIDSVVTDLPGDIDRGSIAIVVLHVTAEHALPSVPPTSTLSDEKYGEYGCMVDFFFTPAVGIYDCGLNDESTTQLKDFMKRYQRKSFQVGSWSHGLCECFGDCRTCTITCIVPCVTFGQTAAAIGEGDCVSCGLSLKVPFLNVITRLGVRGRIREIRGIRGSLLTDCLNITFCPFLSLIQEAREVKGYRPIVQGMDRN